MSTTLKIRPLQDHIIVKPVAQEDRSRGGLIIPETAKEKPQEGWVVAVGGGKVRKDGNLQPLDLVAGDRVLFIKYAGSDVELGGEKHLMLREDDVLGVIESSPTPSGSQS
jgi:chaperonin GroES